MFFMTFLFGLTAVSIAQDEAAPSPQSTIDGAAEEAETEAPAKAESSGINVRLSLTSGVVLQGEVSAAELLAWSAGSPLSFTPEGAETLVVSGDKIALIEQVSADQPTATSSGASKEVDPDVPEYTSPGGFSFPNPASSRYLYAPSSIPLEQGQGYIAQRYAIFSSVAYGATDNVTVLFGTLTPFPPALAIGGLKVAGKVSDKVHIGVAGEVFTMPIDATVLAAVGAGSVTFGTKDDHVTLSSGVIGGEMFSDEFAIPIVISGHKRVSERVGLVTENWIVFPSSGGPPELLINSFVCRILGRRVSPERGGGFLYTDKGYPKSSWDVGVLGFYGSGDFFGPVPYIDYAWHFGT
jgi:hypothetical protein